MKWFENIKTAADPFAFEAPSSPSITWPGSKPSMPKRTTEKELGKFEARDEHIRRIQESLASMDAGRLATLADAIGREDFWANLSVSAPQGTPQGPSEAPQGRMPMQSKIEDDQPQAFERTPSTPTIESLPEALKGTPPAPAIPQPAQPPRTEEGRPPGMQEWFKRKRTPGAT